MKLNLVKPIKKFFSSIGKFFKDHKKVILIVTGILGAIIIAALLFFNLRDTSVTRTDPNSSGEASEPAIVFVASPLTGIEVSPDLANRPTVAVIVENSPEARPQSGLIKSGAIYEFKVEGGITRFVTVHQEQMAEKIGPVRSLRTYFIDVGMGFDAGIAHDGGDPKALVEFRQLGGRDLAGGGAYYRSSDRWAPHNEYTSEKLMYDLMKTKGFTSSEYAPWARKADAPLEIPTASSISIDISSFLYGIDYTYVASSNSYNRFMADQAHKDKETAKQLSPKVVIVVKAPHSVVDGVGHLAIDLVGSGDVWIFQDGGVTKAKWKKSSRTTNMSFVNAEGKDIKLNTGQTWVTVIPTDRTVEYKP